ncbi:MAG: hypothetical protein M3O70_20355, partial [Actinomycetota bacterium]|nr:hypothetical protein [Actinomycetota bacterium]
MRADTVVIIGASGGAGRALARLYGQRGCTLALLARGEAGLDAATGEVKRPPPSGAGPLHRGRLSRAGPS